MSALSLNVRTGIVVDEWGWPTDAVRVVYEGCTCGHDAAWHQPGCIACGCGEWTGRQTP